jgi:hypothetical protein
MKVKHTVPYIQKTKKFKKTIQNSQDFFKKFTF